jgi:hypothetical protein
MSQLNSLSRFRTTPPLIYNGMVTYGRWKLPSFLVNRPANNLIGIFRVTPAVEGRPDLISNQVYGTPQLDWVLIAFNNVRETLNWPKAGDTIEYPVDTVVLPELM